MNPARALLRSVGLALGLEVPREDLRAKLLRQNVEPEIQAHPDPSTHDEVMTASEPIDGLYPLTNDEAWLTNRVRLGLPADFSGGGPAGSGVPVRIRGAVLAVLAGDLGSSSTSSFAVIQARIVGAINLTFLKSNQALRLWNCEFEDELSFQKCHFLDVDLRGSHLAAGFNARSCQMDHDLNLTDVTSDRLISIDGAKIGGRIAATNARLADPEGPCLTADGLTLSGDMFLNGMVATAPIRLTGASVGGQLSLSDSRLSTSGIQEAIVADQAVITGGVFCFRTQVSGELRLLGADIAGQLIMNGGNFSSPTGCSIRADRISVAAGAFFGDGFVARGEVNLTGASIGGQLAASNGRFENPSGNALTATGASIGGDAHLAEEFFASGTVTFNRARIAGSLFLGGTIEEGQTAAALKADGMVIGSDLQCTSLHIKGDCILIGATINGQLNLHNSRFMATQEHAITADGVQVGGDVTCTAGLQVTGELRMLGSRVGGQVGLEGAQLSNPGGVALSCDQAQLTGGLFCRNGFLAQGTVRLDGATIASQVSFIGATLQGLPGAAAISAEGANINHLLLRNIGLKSQGIVDLGGAHVSYLADHPDAWDPFTGVILTDLTYERIATDSWTANGRLGWISKQSSYAPQPYEQLAAVLRSQGHQDDARTILIAKQHQRWLANRRQLWRLPILLLLGGGYRPLQRTVPILLAIYLLGSCYILPHARNAGAVVASRAPAHSTADAGKATLSTAAAPIRATERCPADYPCFSPWAYAGDVSVPLIHSRQTDYWVIAGASNAALMARCYESVATVAGWVLSTAAALGFTAAIRRD
jgi:hypothetical protein